MARDSMCLLPGDDIVHRTERGELRVSLLAPAVLLVKYVGYADPSFAAFVAAVFDATFGERTGLHLFIDCEEQTGYDPEFREQIGRWAKQIVPHLRVCLVLVRSRIVALGVAVVNALAGGVASAVADRQVFRDRLEGAVESSVGIV